MNVYGLNNFKKIGLLANQTAYDFDHGLYVTELLGQKLQRVFIPEHGFFSELQDQVTLDDTSGYSFASPHVEFVSIYGSDKEKSLQFPKHVFDQLDCIVIDIQDVGVRYYTYITSVHYMLAALVKFRIDLPIYVVDHPNPNRSRVEGCPVQVDYASFIGVEGLPHCYGLSFFHLVQWLARKNNYDVNIFELKYNRRTWIQASPNIPTKETCRIYTGQCLLEGTNLSEGRGTTLPFQIFGSPYLHFDELQEIKTNIAKAIISYPIFDKSFDLRPLKFIPTFHKHKGQICNGFQLHVFNEKFHSLIFGLVLMKELSKYYLNDDFYRKGSYEYGNDKTAIELLVGDQFLLDYLWKDVRLKDICEYVFESERRWREEVAIGV